MIYSSRALGHLERAIATLRDEAPAARAGLAGALRVAAECLASNALAGRRIDGDIRELAVSHGRTGLVALYRFVIARDEVRILAIRPQRELGFQP